MFYGEFKTRVDEKWRLRIPASLIGDLDECIINISIDGCVRIYPKQNHFIYEDYPHIFKTRVKKDNRVVIPSKFRSSVSFFYGKSVTLVGFGKYIELWPRP
ncbi:MAG: hypothetical protein WBK67_01860 [Minisyncoccales bacterium]